MSRRNSRSLEGGGGGGGGGQALQLSAPVAGWSNPFLPQFCQWMELISRYDEPKVVRFMQKHPLKAFFEVRVVESAVAASQLGYRAADARRV